MPTLYNVDFVFKTSFFIAPAAYCTLLYTFLFALWRMRVGVDALLSVFSSAFSVLVDGMLCESRPGRLSESCTYNDIINRSLSFVLNLTRKPDSTCALSQQLASCARQGAVPGLQSNSSVYHHVRSHLC